MSNLIDLSSLTPSNKGDGKFFCPSCGSNNLGVYKNNGKDAAKCFGCDEHFWADVGDGNTYQPTELEESRTPAGKLADMLDQNSSGVCEDELYLSGKGLTVEDAGVDIFTPDPTEFSAKGDELEVLARKYAYRWRNTACVVYRDANGKPATAQQLNPKGIKWFLPGKKDVCWYTRRGNSEIVFMTEGVANAISIWKMTGHTAIATGSASSFDRVCRVIRKVYPHSKIILAADNDSGKEQNVGLDTAEKIKSRYALPYIYPIIEGWNSCDWDDVRREIGQVDYQQVVDDNYLELYAGSNKRVSLNRSSTILNDTMSDFFNPRQEFMFSTWGEEDKYEEEEELHHRRVVLLDAECASGKSTSMTNYIGDNNVAIFVDTLDLAEEMADIYFKQSGRRASVIRSLNKENVQEFCEVDRVKRAFPLESRGKSSNDCKVIATKICSSCTIFSCPINIQYNDVDTAVRVYQKAHLMRKNAKDINWIPNKVVIDESPLQTFTGGIKQLPSEMFVQEIASLLQRDIYGSHNFQEVCDVVDKLDLVDAINLAVDFYRDKYDAYEEKREEWVEIAIEQSRGDIARWVSNNPSPDRVESPSGLVALANMIDPEGCKSISPNELIVGLDSISHISEAGNLDKKWKEADVLILDGGGDVEVYNELFRTDVEHIKIRVKTPKCVEIVQISNGTYSRKAMNGEPRKTTVFQYLDSIDTTNKEVGLVSYKDTIEDLRFYSQETYDKFSKTWFGAAKGTNKLAHVDDIITIGRNYPSSEVMLAQARSIFKRRDVISGKMSMVWVSGQYTDGKPRWTLEFLPVDPYVRKIFDQIVRSSIYQAAGRSRWIRKENPGKVTILTSYTSDLLIDSVVTEESLRLDSLGAGTCAKRSDTGTVKLSASGKLDTVRNYIQACGGKIPAQMKLLVDAGVLTRQQSVGMKTLIDHNFKLVDRRKHFWVVK